MAIHTNTKQELSNGLLRFGLAAVFLYAAVSSFQTPLAWVGFMPGFLVRHMSSVLLVRIFAVYELGLVIWLASGKRLQYAALACAATLTGIVLLNPGQLITTFRDIGLACMAAALYLTEK